MGRIRMKRIKDASADSSMKFVRESVAKGSTIVSDGLQSSRALAKEGYLHRRRVLEGSSHEAPVVLPRVHRVAALLKRRLRGTHQGGVSRDYLDYYLDEFRFRFNRRTSQHRGKLFYRLVRQAVGASQCPTTPWSSTFGVQSTSNSGYLSEPDSPFPPRRSGSGSSA